MTMQILRMLACTVALVATGASTAAATTILEPVDAHFPYQRWADEARIPTPEVTITVAEVQGPYSCPALPTEQTAACTSAADSTVWFDPSPRDRARFTFWHELGHRVDYHSLSEWMRSRYMTLLGLTGEWRQEERASRSPHELFAESWAQCAGKPFVAPGFRVGRGPIDGDVPVGGAAVHNRVCRMLARV